MEKKINKYEDAQAIWFSLGYYDIELYSLTTIDAYRTPTAKIVTKDELDNFLKDW
jgi:hypothetical protein